MRTRDAETVYRSDPSAVLKRGVRNTLTGVCALLPEELLVRLIRTAIGDRQLALCFHRVAERRRADTCSEVTTTAATLDRLLALLAKVQPSRRQLTVTFDDGYASAADYIKSRAPRFGQVDWLFFVCPQKTERQAAFRWDAYEVLRHRSPHNAPRLASFLTERLDPLAENTRADLLEAARFPEHRLATVDECRALVELPNVALGNHSNAHLPFSALDPWLLRADLDASFADFRRLFGRCRDFAIPFGTPGLAFSPSQVDGIRQRFEGIIWTTQARPFDPQERVPHALLPRLAPSGNWSARRMAGWIAVKALQTGGRRIPGVATEASERGARSEFVRRYDAGGSRPPTPRTRTSLTSDAMNGTGSNVEPA